MPPRQPDLSKTEPANNLASPSAAKWAKFEGPLSNGSESAAANRIPTQGGQTSA